MIYDNKIFFEKYSDLRLNDKGINHSIEIPCIRELIGAVSGKSVLDIGCGHGQQLVWLKKNGARRVVGLDPSKNMIEYATKSLNGEDIHFINGYYEACEIEEKVDLITSSMALHYVEDLDVFFRKCFEDLSFDGQIVFSCEHPMCTANPTGFNQIESEVYWNVKDYSFEEKKNQKWFVDGVIKYHRTLSTIINSLIGAGFMILQVEEPIPQDKEYSIQERKESIHWVRPPILVVKAQKMAY